MTLRECGHVCLRQAKVTVFYGFHGIHDDAGKFDEQCGRIGDLIRNSASNIRFCLFACSDYRALHA